ncbi:hypothetical protein [Salisaeta icosahedral phage 1]|uniref:transcriptional regulator n=1 Tax=Salisaeta icosahedral phage 1 TaxID=1183239 RepID=UPI00025EA91C|nr:transcriptional regulator [Salisaeta icosahedral phage 1]AFJ21470.1 hypothetical protein [Salisaeta icosahedral phage 1]
MTHHTVRKKRSEHKGGAMTTPAEIRALRRDLGLRQVDFCEVLGVHQTTLSDWESGRSSPDLYKRTVLEQLRRRLREAEREQRTEQFRSKLLRASLSTGLHALFRTLFSGEVK